MDHNICLNIHYTAPEEIWDKINNVYKTMPYWDDSDSNRCPHWSGKEIDIEASVEPGGIQISGQMPEHIWKEWYKSLTEKLSQALGYEIGNPEDGFPFKFWTPFKKKYSDVKSIEKNKIVFSDYSTFFWDYFDMFERNCDAKPPYFYFHSKYIELWIFFDNAGLKKRNIKDFHDFKSKLDLIGIKTLDLS